MIQKLKTLIVTFAAASVLVMPLAVVGTAVAADPPTGTAPPTTSSGDEVSPGLCAGANLDATNTTCDSSTDTGATSKINDIIKLVINLFSLLVGVVAVIMIIVGGLKYITSSGDSGNVTSAKNTILYAIIGLVIVALAQFVVRFVLNKVSTSGGA